MFDHFSDDAVIRMKYRLVRIAYLVKSDHRRGQSSAENASALDLLPLLASLHDRLQAFISRTNHLKHPLVFRRSVEECGKMFVWIRVLHCARVAALTVVDPYHRRARKRSA